MGKKIILLLFMAVFLFSVVNAQPPFETTSTGGLQFGYSPYETVKENTAFTLHLHVINNTAVQRNTTTSCLLHLYNSNGSHILEKQMGFDSNNVEFTYTIAGGNFTKGQHAYVIQCNNTGKEIHLVNGIFTVTSTGRMLDQAQSLLVIGLIIILIFIFLINLFGINLLPDSNERNPEGQIISISYLKYLRPILWFTDWMILVGIFYITSNLAFAYLPDELLGKILFTFFQISFGLTPVILIIWIIGLFMMFWHDREFQKLINRGFFPTQI